MAAADVQKSLIKYLPYAGGVSYSVLALNTMGINLPFLGDNGRLIVFNSTLAFSHVGFGVYIYNRPILDVIKPSKTKRTIWSIFGSWMMNLGSVLFWAIAKELGPSNKFARAFIGLSAGGVFLYVATDLTNSLDKLKRSDFPIEEDRDSGNEDDEE
ncbi:uncharacterized protein LOC110247817 [Exaiptasia diaphana]|uniref:Uncharacterized protein n=1 Tax=Exaiptasia diaphana TaxID=2652724 RepID=A0A913YR93_EXADI|nr:uncharacterized protein LOC110247817 [Exaiptasia diaphana]